MDTEKLEIKIGPGIRAELEYIVALHKKSGAPNGMDTLEDLIAYILASVADGSRSPGSWERELLEKMGLVSDADEHQVYRSEYGTSEGN